MLNETHLSVRSFGHGCSQAAGKQKVCAYTQRIRNGNQRIYARNPLAALNISIKRNGNIDCFRQFLL